MQKGRPFAPIFGTNWAPFGWEFRFQLEVLGLSVGQRNVVGSGRVGRGEELKQSAEDVQQNSAEIGLEQVRQGTGDCSNIHAG